MRLPYTYTHTRPRRLVHFHTHCYTLFLALTFPLSLLSQQRHFSFSFLPCAHFSCGICFYFLCLPFSFFWKWAQRLYFYSILRFIVYVKYAVRGWVAPCPSSVARRPLSATSAMLCVYVLATLVLALTHSRMLQVLKKRACPPAQFCQPFCLDCKLCTYLN